VEDLDAEIIGSNDEVAGGGGCAQGIVLKDSRVHRLVGRQGGNRQGIRHRVTVHFHSVDPHYKSVVDVKSHLQCADVRNAAQEERVSQKEAGIRILHVRHLGAAGPDVAVPEGGGSGGEGGVDEVAVAPEIGGCGSFDGAFEK